MDFMHRDRTCVLMDAILVAIILYFADEHVYIVSSILGINKW